MKKSTSSRESQVRLIWPCYENENVGRTMFGDWSGSRGRCAGGIVIIVREVGRGSSESEVAYLSSPFRRKKKKKERERKIFRWHAKVRLRTDDGEREKRR